MATDLKSWATKQRSPFTLGLVVTLVAYAILAWATQGRAIQGFATGPTSEPWSFVVYPWAFNPLNSAMGLIFLIFLAIWLIQFGGAVEREMGTPRFALFWLTFTLIPALIAGVLGLSLAGPWLPAAAIIVAWCARNQNGSILLYGVLPISGTWLAVLTAAGVVVTFGNSNPANGVMMAIPLGLVWIFAKDILPFAFSGGRPARGAKVTVVRGAASYEETYFENVKDREIEREERERLRKLFEGK